MRKEVDVRKVRRAIRELRGHVRRYINKAPLAYHYGVKVYDGRVEPWVGAEEERFNEVGVISIIKPYSSRDLIGFLSVKLDDLVKTVIRKAWWRGYEVKIDKEDRLREWFEKFVEEEKMLEEWSREYEEEIMRSLSEQ